MPTTRKTKPASATADAATGDPTVAFRMRVMLGDTIAIGPGKVALLEAIRDHGSISRAAKSLEMSYRRAWVLLQEINQSMRVPAVSSDQGGQHGGGSVLTPEGEAVIRLYRTIEQQAMDGSATQIRDLLALLAGPSS